MVKVVFAFRIDSDRDFCVFRISGSQRKSVEVGGTAVPVGKPWKRWERIFSFSVELLGFLWSVFNVSFGKVKEVAGNLLKNPSKSGREFGGRIPIVSDVFLCKIFGC